MTNLTTPTAHHHTNTSFPASDGHAPARASVSAGEPDPARAPRDFKSIYTPKVIDMMCAPIRRCGLSDDAAAESVGLRIQTLWRWKHDHPEVRQKLQQARRECHLYYVELIARMAEGAGPLAFRAATWMAERVFPGDYGKTMRERWNYQTFEEQRDRNELREVGDEIWAEKEAARREELRAQQAAAAEAAQPAAASENGSQNVISAGATEAPAACSVSDHELHSVINADTTEAPTACAASKRELHNVKNSPESARPGPEAVLAVSETDLQNVINPGRPDAGPLMEAIFGPRATALYYGSTQQEAKP